MVVSPWQSSAVDTDGGDGSGDLAHVSASISLPADFGRRSGPLPRDVWAADLTATTAKVGALTSRDSSSCSALWAELDGLWAICRQHRAAPVESRVSLAVQS